MNVKEMINSINGKCNELNGILDSIKENTEWSENTKRTQTFQKKRELHNLLIMRELCNGLDANGVVDLNLNDTIVDWFKSATASTLARKAKYIIEVHEGDSVMELLQKHAMVKDVWNKIQKSMEKQGLRNVNGIIVK